MTEQEGVVKYRLDHARAEPFRAPELAELDAWRSVLHRLGLVGQQADRYDGYGFGNVSVRTSRGFFISGTQTGRPERLGDTGYALVLSANVDVNSVESTGPVAPSSEALTHAAVYQLDPQINCVLHAHSPDIWVLPGLPATPADVPYGTPAMARAVRRCFDAMGRPTFGLFVMAGHEDGAVSFGPDLATAAGLLIETLARCWRRQSESAGVGR